MTALYEIILEEGVRPKQDLATLRLRYETPELMVKPQNELRPPSRRSESKLSRDLHLNTQQEHLQASSAQSSHEQIDSICSNTAARL